MFFLPVAFSAVFGICLFVFVFIIIFNHAKKANNLNVKSSEIFQKTFSSFLKEDEKIVCEYCKSVLPKGATKCPNCSAGIKQNSRKP